MQKCAIKIFNVIVKVTSHFNEVIPAAEERSGDCHPCIESL